MTEIDKTVLELHIAVKQLKKERNDGLDRELALHVRLSLAAREIAKLHEEINALKQGMEKRDGDSN